MPVPRGEVVQFSHRKRAPRNDALRDTNDAAVFVLAFHPVSTQV